MRTVGATVRSERLQRGWSQAELARRMESYQTVVSSLERDPDVPSVFQLRRLSQALGVEIGELLPEPGDTFPERLRYTRLAHGMSQDQVAKRAGLSHPFISMLENSRRVPRLDQIQRLAEVLEVEVGWLIAENGT